MFLFQLQMLFKLHPLISLLHLLLPPILMGHAWHLASPQHLVQLLYLLQRASLGYHCLDIPHLFWSQASWIGRPVCGFWQRFSRYKCFSFSLNFFQLSFAFLSLKQSFSCIFFLLFDFFEIQNSEIWKLVDDIFSVVPLGNNWVVEEGEKSQLLQAGDWLKVSQLL